MSIAAISYSSLSNASSEAKSVARKLGSYADSLTNNVYNKLNSYSGEWTSSLSVARSKTLTKINDLEADQTNYENYATALSDLKSECQTVDRAVKSMVSTLTASFKEAYGISNNVVTNSISYFYTSVTNSTWLGRAVNTLNDIDDAGRQYIKDSIKEWYNYDGGEELIKGVVVAVVEIALAVVAIAIAITTAGILVPLASLILGMISLANAMTNLYNEAIAYGYTNTFNDPATAYRRSEIDTLADYMKSSFIFTDKGVDTDDYDEFYAAYERSGNQYYAIAVGIEIATVICTIITFAAGFAKLLKVASPNAVNTINVKKSIGEKIADAIKKKYWDFSNITSELKSYKAILSFAKNLVKGDSLKVFTAVVTDAFLPGLTGFTTTITENNVTKSEEDESLGDFYKVFEDAWKLWGEGGSVGKLLDLGDIDVKVLGKLNSVSDVDISIPEISITISVPQINTNVAV
ncbi:MAG: hypothetical protein LUF29_02635 [Oscillospiraceae bacterium]|nr:hypothetical protein [Oscillospiraceae bacterium]